MENSVKTIVNNLARVENMVSSRSGREVPNQFIIKTKDVTIFQSYGTIIAVKANGQTILDKDKWDYSVTTGKYRNEFLGFNKKETEKLIASGSIKLANLN